MTIAACYLSSEGVVLGADSTATSMWNDPSNLGAKPVPHHMNFAQKIFEIGDKSTLGIVAWGLGSIGNLSHRMIVSRFADDLAGSAVHSVHEAAVRFSTKFWPEYTTRLAAEIAKLKALDAKTSRTAEEQEERDELFYGLSGGYCIGGHVLDDRTPQAMQLVYSPDLIAPPVPTPLVPGQTGFWGCPALIRRLVLGIDDEVIGAILASKKWSGTDEELIDIATQKKLAPASELPLREAIDWIYTMVYTTIKGMKFSHLLPICGGPIEIAVMSCDRNFRWVRHKRFDEALP